MNAESAAIHVATQLIANAARDIEWEDTPEIGEADWLRIQHHIERLAPETRFWNEAIIILEERAEKWAKAQDAALDTDALDDMTGGNPYGH